MIPMIRALPKETADKIAAGEVVERPLSAVKELVENSIDAGADSITVEIKNAGKSYIRVTDNGCGIRADQLDLAFRRYATSKIYDDEDLNNIRTLGFRGEALASIASVSRAEMLTKTEEERTGSRIVIMGGETEISEEAACEKGTTIIITDLFYNTPARRKFLKSDSFEAGLITDYISKMALAYPSVRFRMINNGNILFSTTGRGDLRSAVATVYDPAIAKNLLPVDESACDGELKLRGLTAAPSASKSSRRNQVFFVNGRWVKSRLFENALDEAYRDKLFEGHFPPAFLFLDIDPYEVDVNIHPNKTDVRFYNEDSVRSFITASLRKALLVKDAAPSAVKNIDFAEKEETEKNDGIGLFRGASEKEIIDINHFTSVNNTEVKEDTLPVYDEHAEPVKNSPVNTDPENEDTQDFFSSLRKEKVKAEQLPMFETGKTRDFFFNDLQYIGQVFAAYIIAKDQNGLYLIDQHAAHERVLYEKLLRDFNTQKTASQLMLMPLVIDIPVSLKLEAEERFELLRRLGFSVEDFGPSAVAVKEIPACMSDQEAEEFLNTVIEAENLTRYDIQQRRELLISRACKSAIKANDHMSDKEVKALFAQLDECENPFSCPHGRPTFIRYSEYEIEHLFKRK